MSNQTDNNGTQQDSSGPADSLTVVHDNTPLLSNDQQTASSSQYRTLDAREYEEKVLKWGPVSGWVQRKFTAYCKRIMQRPNISVKTIIASGGWFLSWVATLLCVPVEVVAGFVVYFAGEVTAGLGYYFHETRSTVIPQVNQNTESISEMKVDQYETEGKVSKLENNARQDSLARQAKDKASILGGLTENVAAYRSRLGQNSTSNSTISTARP